MEPENFSFPFEPYDIQIQFMKHLYNALENGKLGIFESPTGTGKSLSLCCAAIQWLKDHNEKHKNLLIEQIKTIQDETKDTNDGSEDWLCSEYNKIKKINEMHILQKQLANINLQEERIQKLRTHKTDQHSRPKNIQRRYPKKDKDRDLDSDPKDEPTNDTEESEFLLEEKEEYNSDPEDDDEPNADEENPKTKIIFCSRTHSQLSQFINEIKKTKHSDVSVVSLASRQQYCINPTTLNLKSQHLINERCLDLQKGKSGKKKLEAGEGKVLKKCKTSCGCQFYNQTQVESLKDDILIDIKNIEDLVIDGKEAKACPYYSARAAVKDSQVIVLPYQTILHKGTRSANGISLKNSIVIIDEAHNLLETIGHIYGSEIYGHQLEVALEKLKNYKNKYNSRFSAKNLLCLSQIIFIVGRVLSLLQTQKETKDEQNSEIYTIGEFLIKAEIDNYNLRPLVNFCHQSKLSQKLHGFASSKYANEINNKDTSKHGGLERFLKNISKNSTTTENTDTTAVNEQNSNNEKYISVCNVFQSFLGFLEMLTSTYSDGRVVTNRGKTPEESFHKFLLLNPAAQFSDIVNEARAVIVAGGTMQPFSEFRDQLFISAGGSADRIVEFSCGHVIPPENILPICLSVGPSGKSLNFTYKMRKKPDMLIEIGSIILNLCKIVPGGIVCFFPSYDYENLVYDHLSSYGIIEKIQNKKKVFREPKKSGQVDGVLEAYSKVIHHSKTSKSAITGALMLSVVGGKLSEGLNFSDDLGRCVIVIGMPYPNSKSVELQEKMKYLKENVSQTAGNVHYENLCLKAVNQCIGRAVRHAKDYATVVLVDERYSRERISNALPKWIQTSLVSDAKFSNAFALIRNFFVARK